MLRNGFITPSYIKHIILYKLGLKPKGLYGFMKIGKVMRDARAVSKIKF